MNKNLAGLRREIFAFIEADPLREIVSAAIQSGVSHEEWVVFIERQPIHPALKAKLENAYSDVVKGLPGNLSHNYR